ncbi:endo alpha-1,4 polygalactosaminidase [Microbacterium sp. 77mftsu3.1]|uniref:endo alpha-1,4 polygalactosaminidase n=1 Tax=Microbacterium sp. 77mftsu3.1 TaxID=1761802 RepID=UPI0003722129|nr:endo alpha-1,4 polygalactosaminidase [Microbacterium sp. 77mftsu3.1]SDH55457.1 Glycoside-hydrolase family GH114 [Microbacterium sp. 77mftsu3.1]
MRATTRARAVVAAAALLALLMAGGAAPAGAEQTDAMALAAAAKPAPKVKPYPVGATPDYQLGGAYTVPKGVTVVVRDRLAKPAKGVYSICYVNAFQTQPGELAKWPKRALLRDAQGKLVHDPGWPDEVIVDTRRADDVVKTVTPWIRDCAKRGFAAVEFDNLDTYTRTKALTRTHNAAVAKRLVAVAHSVGLAAAQKNAAEDSAVLRKTARFDFAIAEECSVWKECGTYAKVYGKAVLAVEYSDDLPVSFKTMCARKDAPLSMVLRDRDLVTPKVKGYVFRTCG